MCRKLSGIVLTKTPDSTPVKLVSVVLRDSLVLTAMKQLHVPFASSFRHDVPWLRLKYLAHFEPAHIFRNKRVTIFTSILPVPRSVSSLLLIHILDEINIFSKSLSQLIIHVPARQCNSKASCCDAVRGELCCCCVQGSLGSSRLDHHDHL